MFLILFLIAICIIIYLLRWRSRGRHPKAASAEPLFNPTSKQRASTRRRKQRQEGLEGRQEQGWKGRCQVGRRQRGWQGGREGGREEGLSQEGAERPPSQVDQARHSDWIHRDSLCCAHCHRPCGQVLADNLSHWR